jgi:hypothetical protein
MEQYNLEFRKKINYQKQLCYILMVSEPSNPLLLLLENRF